MERSTRDVIDALYDVPLGGDWQNLQTVLCQFWEASGPAPNPDDIAELERHFDRAFTFLERLPSSDSRWRHELFRIPVPACVIDAKGDIVEANDAGRRHLGIASETAIELSQRSRLQLANALRGLTEEEFNYATVAIDELGTLDFFVNRVPEHLHAGDKLYLAVIVTRQLPSHATDLLMTKFGLTEAEAQLALKLAAGNSLDDVAKQSQQKKTTLRTHLARTFSKLDINSQPALVSLVLHTVFAAAHLEIGQQREPTLTPHLDPQIHGHPRFIKHQLADGRFIGCLEYGDPDGIPAIYLHGSFGSGLFMNSQRLAGNGVRLLAVERGGVGETSPSPDPSPEAYAQDILSLCTHLGLEEFVVIGRSMGSWDALSVALADQERVKLLVLTGGRLPVQASEEHIHNPFYTNLFNAIWHSDMMGRLLLRMMLVRLLALGPEKILNSDRLLGVEGQLNEDPLYARHMQANWLRAAEGGADPIHHHLKLYRDPVPNPPWLNFATPTLLFHGQEDQIVPAERIIEQTDSFKHRKVLLLPDVAHRLVQLAMGEVLRVVRSEWEARKSSS